MTLEEIYKDIARIKEQALNDPDKHLYKCPICKDRGYFLYQIDGKGQDTMFRCECAEKRLAVDRMRRCGILEEDRNKTLNDFDTFGEKPLVFAKKTVEKYMEQFGELKDTRTNSLLLMGRSGSGKTMLGIIASMHIINNHSTGLMYVSYRNMITNLKQNVMDEYAYNMEMGKLINTPVLFIDDLFKGKITESDINIMYEIVNTRYLQRKPLIISTECDINKLLDIDEAIGSRIVEMSKGHIVVFDDSTMNYRMR